MKSRYRLRLHLALAIATALNGSVLNYSAAVRQCTRSYLTAFSIREDTLLSGTDWLKALQLATQERNRRVWDRIPIAQLPSFHRMKNVAESFPW